MPVGPEWWSESPRLRQLFGSVLGSADQGLSTSQVWDTLRTAANNAAAQSLKVSLGRTPTQPEIDIEVGKIFKGVNAATVSRMRGAAGQYVRAKRNLQSLSRDQQITADSVGTFPWSRTASIPGIPTRYEVKTKFMIEDKNNPGLFSYRWSTYIYDGALTNMNDILNYTQSLYESEEYLEGFSVVQAVDYAITLQ